MIRSQCTAAFYPPEGWSNRFARHIDDGLYDVSERVHTNPDAPCVAVTAHSSEHTA